jgi:hypothetical protein
MALLITRSFGHWERGSFDIYNQIVISSSNSINYNYSYVQYNLPGIY